MGSVCGKNNKTINSTVKLKINPAPSKLTTYLSQGPRIDPIVDGTQRDYKLSATLGEELENISKGMLMILYFEDQESCSKGPSLENQNFASNHASRTTALTSGPAMDSNTLRANNTLNSRLGEPGSITTGFHAQSPCGAHDRIEFVRGELIGSGAYGQVYQALNMINGQLIAVKTVKFTGNSVIVEKEVQTLRHEISLLRQLAHKNIVKYLYSEACEDKQGIDIILEYVPGGSIRNLLNKFTKFDEQLTHLYTKQVLDGLIYLHENGIIHRDLKCANILVDNDGTIKLSDFGASKKLQSDLLNDGIENNKSLKGSPYWMAPEVISRIGHGRPADIWSLGCCVLEMLTSNPPWSSISKSAKVILNTIKNSQAPPPEIPGNLSRECMDFLLKCFQRDPSIRPTAEELKYHPFILGIKGISEVLSDSSRTGGRRTLSSQQSQLRNNLHSYQDSPIGYKQRFTGQSSSNNTGVAQYKQHPSVIMISNESDYSRIESGTIQHQLSNQLKMNFTEMPNRSSSHSSNALKRPLSKIEDVEAQILDDTQNNPHKIKQNEFIPPVQEDAHESRLERERQRKLLEFELDMEIAKHRDEVFNLVEPLPEQPFREVINNFVVEDHPVLNKNDISETVEVQML